MRYTRYDYKKNNGGFLGFLVIVIVLSIVIGIGIFKLFFKGDNKIISPEKKPQSTETNANTSSNIKGEKTFIAIQCGVFSTKENADKAVNALPSSFSGFINEDEGKFKVMAGLYSEEEGNKKSDELTAANVENYKAKLVIKTNDTDSKVKAEVIEAYLKINSTLSNNEVKSVKTAELKSWIQDVEKNQKVSEKEVEDLIDKINNLPEDVTKSNIQEYTVYIYNMICKYKA